ncbi:MAG: hypothetical protein Q9P90_05200 [candidate division KSB1 bacterium]|nr:hypothetical protein [candidate division KSB1 bacterium]
MRLHPDPVIDRIFQSIAKDNVSGASVLFKRAFELFPRMAEILSQQEDRELKPFLQDVAKKLVDLQPGMAPFVHLARYIDNFTSGKFDKNVIMNAFRAFPLAADRLIEKQKRAIVKTALNETAGMRRILTHSRSSLVERFLREWLGADRKREVFATESRPVGEGVQLLEALQELPNRKTLLVDDARSLIMPKIDAVVIGADRICEQNLLNKIGTLALALLAREMNKPVFVLADGSKMIPAKLCQHKERFHPPEEIQLKANRFEIMNLYFEEVPNSFFRFITADGVANARDIRAHFRQGRWEMFCFETDPD